MTFIPDDPSTIETAQLASYATRFVGKDTGTESFLGKLARAEAQGLWAFEKKLERISQDTVPSSLTTYDRLADYATLLGLDNGDSGYGPLVATAATGLTAKVTGTPAATCGATDQIIAADGVTLFVPTATFTVGGGGTVVITMNATITGIAGNLILPAALNFVSPPAGIQTKLVLVSGATNGTDVESAEDLLVRILNRLQLPPKGGTQNDWNVWCDEALPAVNRVYGYAHRHGTGTVDEVCTYAVGISGIGSTRQLTAGNITTIQTYLDLNRPVTCAGRYVLTPYMPAANALTIQTRIVPYDAGAFDWATLAALHVHTYAATGGIVDPLTGLQSAQITLSANIPADLITAIDLGTRPRMQLICTNTGAPICPLMVECLKYSAGALASDKIDCVIPTATSWIAPINGNLVFPGSDACLYVPQALHAYINSLGPSRASGFADPDDDWLSTVETEQLNRIAFNTQDALGNDLVSNIVKTYGVPQTLIAVGVAAATTYDYTPGDTYTNAPECASVARIYVTD